MVEQLGLDAVVGVDQHLPKANEAGPVDCRPGSSAFWSHCPGGFADDLDETFGDEAEVFVLNPGIEVDGEETGQLLGGVEDIGDAVLRPPLATTSTGAEQGAGFIDEVELVEERAAGFELDEEIDVARRCLELRIFDKWVRKFRRGECI
jgi:hypothetical protein